MVIGFRLNPIKNYVELSFPFWHNVKYRGMMIMIYVVFSCCCAYYCRLLVHETFFVIVFSKECPTGPSLLEGWRCRILCAAYLNKAMLLKTLHYKWIPPFLMRWVSLAFFIEQENSVRYMLLWVLLLSVLIYTQVSENLSFGACILSPKGWLLLLWFVEEWKPVSSKYKTFTSIFPSRHYCDKLQSTVLSSNKTSLNCQGNRRWRIGIQRKLWKWSDILVCFKAGYKNNNSQSNFDFT